MFPQISLGLDAGEDIGLAKHEQILPVDLYLGPAVLAVEDLVVLLHVQRDALAILVELAVADCEDLALLRLLLGGVGEDDPTGCGLLLLDGPHDQPIAQGLELHVEKPPSGENATGGPPPSVTWGRLFGTLGGRVPTAPAIYRRSGRFQGQIGTLSSRLPAALHALRAPGGAGGATSSARRRSPSWPPSCHSVCRGSARS